MGTTTPDGLPVPIIDDSPDVPRDILALATAIGPELVQKFSTTTQRNTAFASVAFTKCNVAGVEYQRVGSQWIECGGLGWGAGALSSTTDQAVSHTTWSKLGLPASGGYIEGDGVSVSGAGNGLLVAATGRYVVYGYVAWSGTTGGRRGAGVDISTATIPGRPTQQVIPGFSTSTPGQQTGVQCMGELSVAAGSVISLWGYQDSGSPLAAQDRTLQVRRVA